MSTSKRYVYSVAIDGGAPGPVPLRGPELIDEGYLFMAIVCTELFVTSDGALASFGWAGAPDLFINPTDLVGNFSFVPDQIRPTPQNAWLHTLIREPLVMTISVGTFTAGALLVNLESYRV